MKRPLIFIACGIGAAALAWTGCDGETGGGEDDDGAGGTTQTTSSSTNAASSSTGNAASSSTGAGATGPGCDAPADSPSNGSCIAIGGGVGGGSGGGGGAGGDMTGTTIDCNPVTNEPCAAGDACDATQGGGFLCFPPPNNSMICQACDNTNGPFCAGGLGCAMGFCAKYCCDDGDCGTGTCTKGGFPADADLGVCGP